MPWHCFILPMSSNNSRHPVIVPLQSRQEIGFFRSAPDPRLHKIRHLAKSTILNPKKIIVSRFFYCMMSSVLIFGLIINVSTPWWFFLTETTDQRRPRRLKTPTPPQQPRDHDFLPQAWDLTLWAHTLRTRAFLGDLGLVFGTMTIDLRRFHPNKFGGERGLKA